MSAEPANTIDPADAGKPVILLAGNCQARVLGNCLRESPEVRENYRVVYFRNFRKGDQGALDPEDLKDCAILLEQIAHQAAELPGKELLPADCRVIRFPILWLNSLWPMTVDDARNDALPNKEIRYPYGDRVILKLLDAGKSDNKAAKLWLQDDVTQRVDLDRFHEINAAKAINLDERAELKFGGFVLENFRDRRLFVSRNHPSLEMVDHMRRVVFAQLGIAPPQSDLKAASGGLGDHHVPVHPKVAEHFGLTWWSPEMVYPHHAGPCTIHEYMRRYAAFE